jgi:hypothetical protein
VANINRFQIGTDGKTAHERLRGRKFRRDIAEFGERVMYLKADSVGKDKFSSRWEPGFFLGIKEESGEVIIGTEDGVIKTRSFKRRGSEGERWSSDDLAKVKGSPWEPIPGRDDIELKTSVHIDTGPTVHEPMEGFDKQVVKRRFKITKDDVRNHGMTPGCHGITTVRRSTILKPAGTEWSKNLVIKAMTVSRETETDARKT